MNNYNKTVKHVELEDNKYSNNNEIDIHEVNPSKHHEEDEKEEDEDIGTFRGDQFSGYAEKEWAQIPIKTLLLPIFLLIAGIAFIIVGFVSYSDNDNAQKIASFFIFGGILSIPGFYYTLQLIQAYRAESPEERNQILEEIPV